MAFNARTKEYLLIVSTEELKLQDTLMQLPIRHMLMYNIVNAYLIFFSVWHAWLLKKLFSLCVQYEQHSIN